MTKKEEKGITLIALVVTIVVLLILVSVSIAMLTGENGLITKAKLAREQTIIGEEKEGISIAYSACKIENDMKNVTAKRLEEAMKADGKDVTVTQELFNLEIKYNQTEHEYTINQNGEINEENTNSQNNSEAIVNAIIIDTEHAIIEKKSGEVVYVELTENYYSGGTIIGEINNTTGTVITQSGIKEKGDRCFIDNEGKVYTWGEYIGDGTTEEVSIPKCISNIEGSELQNKKIVEISNYYYSYIAVDEDGQVYVWGVNYEGILGTGTTEDILMPQNISTIEGNCLNGKKIIDVSYEYLLDEEGKVYEISTYNNQTEKYEMAQCISDDNENILYGKKIVKINCGYYFMAIDSEGKIYCKDTCLDDIEGSIIKDKKITDYYNGVLIMDEDGNRYLIECIYNRYDEKYTIEIKEENEIVYFNKCFLIYQDGSCYDDYTGATLNNIKKIIGDGVVDCNDYSGSDYENLVYIGGNGIVKYVMSRYFYK